ncbi:MAG: hypothetical protein ABIH03_06560 [Pseudomonadota bacterium]
MTDHEMLELLSRELGVSCTAQLPDALEHLINANRAKTSLIARSMNMIRPDSPVYVYEDLPAWVAELVQEARK